MRQLLKSATNTLPVTGDTARPLGWLKEALVPRPFALPLVPALPATVTVTHCSAGTGEGVGKLEDEGEGDAAGSEFIVRAGKAPPVTLAFGWKAQLVLPRM
jgi:hypothetical protein